MTEKQQQYIDAVKVDILVLLQRDNPGIFEFRRISDICHLFMGLAGSTDTFEEHRAIEGILRAAEVKAPTLHEVLINEAFDAKGLLRKKYEQLVAQERELRAASFNISEAADRIKMEDTRLAAKDEALQLHAKHLERERERLQLTAATTGVQINLPALPEILNPEEETTDD